MFDTLTRMGSSAAGAYEIERSLRFNDDDSAYLNRTLAAGTQTKWTFSCWIKLGSIKNSFHAFFSAFTGSSDQYNMIGLDGSNRVVFATQDEGSGGVMNVISTAMLRDPSAWYHIVTTYDSAQSTASDRVKGYINGVECTSFSTETYPSQNRGSYISSNNQHNIGKRWNAAYFDGYMTEIHFCDNQAYTASDFGETNAATGQWVPKEFAGSYGTNGFYLNFSDNSGTTATTLGKDSSGNSNNFTPNNFSVSAGVGYDSMVDTPTNSYPILNTLDGYSTVSYVPLNAGLDFSIGDTSEIGLSTIALPTSGKWYAECTPNALESVCFGIRDVSIAANRGSNVFEKGILYLYYGKTWKDNSEIETVTAPTSGDIMGCAVDRDNNTVQFSLNGTNVGNTIAMTTTEEYQWWVARGASSGSNPTGSVNFGQRAFSHQPSGFKGLCTNELPEPSILKGTDNFIATPYTGNATDDRSIAVGFQPDLTILKQREYTKNWYWYDSIRGANKQILSNGTNAEAEIAQ